MDATDQSPAPATAATADAHGDDTDESSAVVADAHVKDPDEQHIEDGDMLAAAMRRRLDALPGKPHESEPFTIFRVAGAVRDRNKNLYEPQMVSIGPFHRGAARLKAMEEHKWRYLRDLLSRNADAPFEQYVREARAMEARARRCYSESVNLMSGEFAEMLVLDGCFIIEFFLKGEDREADALCDTSWATQNIYSDLFLLENQIPFFVIERLYDVFTGGVGREFLVVKVLAKYLTVDGPHKTDTALPPDGEIHHLLHLYYHWFLPSDDQDRGGDTDATKMDEDAAFDEWLAKPVDERMPWLLPGASELQDAGVKFRTKKSPKSLVDITFRPRDGVIEIPAVENYTNRPMFANLLAYEQSRGRWEMQRLMSYVLLMSSVVDTRRDVEILQRAGVFMKGDDETAAFYSHLGELCPMLDVVNNYYADMFRDVKKYCDRSWNRHRAILVHDYFSNPWTTMSAVAAVFLLVLTVVQTVYTVYPYYHPNPG